MDPPPWWRAAHPDEVMQWEDGRRDKAVPASPRYRRDAADRLAALIARLEQTLGDHIAGYHPAGQNTGEWFYEGAWEKPLSGFAPADRAAWRAWLAGRYASDTDLCAAWRTSGLSRADAPLPTAEARRSAPGGYRRDPAGERMLIDWADFQQEAMAGCVTGLARAARTASGGRKLVLFFYGYTFELAGLHAGAPVSGHLALRQVLDCPDIDVLCAPIAYFDRGPGGDGPAMAPAESVALAGKLWLNEDDTHTALATEEVPGSRDHAATFEQTADLLARNVAQCALRNQATWWMDLCGTGWFNEPEWWDVLDALRPLDEALLARPSPFQPEIAAVVDEQALREASARAAPVTWPGIYEARRALGRCGAPYGQYLLDDVLAGRVPARVLVLLNPWRLDDVQRARLADPAAGRVILWCQPGVPAGTATNAHAWVVPPGGLTPDLLRAAARRAGVHLYTDTDCHVYAGGGFVALHGAQDETVTVDAGHAGPLFDLRSGALVGQGPVLRLPLRRGETRVLRGDTSSADQGGTNEEQPE
jgi:beta-galactosidase